MKTNWPSKLIFKFTSDEKLVSDLLVHFVLLSRLKNNFTIGSFTTNQDGEIKLTHEIMQETIEKAKSDYPMDYSGTLDDCIGVEVIVETMSELRSRINKGKEFYPNKADKLKELTQKCSNEKYKGEHIIYKQPIDFEFVKVTLTGIGGDGRNRDN